MPEWPGWWEWDLELTPHLERRMEDRGFTEVDLRAMLDSAVGFRQGAIDGRFIIETRHRGHAWQVVVEPDNEESLLVVITAYRASN